MNQMLFKPTQERNAKNVNVTLPQLILHFIHYTANTVRFLYSSSAFCKVRD